MAGNWSLISKNSKYNLLNLKTSLYDRKIIQKKKKAQSHSALVHVAFQSDINIKE